ncbi:hypothetical protein [Methylobacterium sp. A54F]
MRERREPTFGAPASAPRAIPVEVLPEPTAPPLRRPLVGFAARALAAIAVIAALSLFARGTIERHPPVRAAEAPQTRETTLTVAFVPAAAQAARPAVPADPAGARFTLDDPDALDPVRAEPGRLNPGTGLREDALARGDFLAIEAPALRLTVTQGITAEPAPSLFVTLARRAADGPGLSVIRTGERGRIATKFGAVETLEATLAGAVRRTCTGFVSLEAAPVRLDGWLCAPLGLPPEPRALACVLDALVLEGHPDPATEAVFREAKVRRDPACRPAAQPAARLAERGGQTGSIGQVRSRTKK